MPTLIITSLAFGLNEHLQIRKVTLDTKHGVDAPRGGQAVRSEVVYAIK